MTATTYGPVLTDFAALVGVDLDPQCIGALSEMCSVNDDGKWLNPEYVVRVGGEILDVRALAGLFLFDERTILWVCSSAGESKASFRRITRMIEASPQLSQRVAKFHRTNGGQGIELHNGSRLLFTSPLGARGCSADVLLIDGLLSSRDELNIYPVVACASNPQRVQRV